VSDDWETKGVAARWRPDAVRENVPVRAGRPPQMTDRPWLRTGQGLEAGRTEGGEFWRCKEPHCRRFAGPYRNAMDAREDAGDHRNLAHPPEERKRAREERQRSREGRPTRGRSR
jgi:hypothetical protein